MSQKNGQRTLLEISKTKAGELVQTSAQEHIILHNDNLYGTRPLSPLKARDAIENIQVSYKNTDLKQAINALKQLAEEYPKENLDCYFFSDFQQQQFPLSGLKDLPRNIYFNGIQIDNTESRNLYIDTAYFESPFLQIGRNTALIVKSRRIGKENNTPAIIQLLVDGQVKSAASPVFDSEGKSIDTIGFEPQKNHWEKLELVINDDAIGFDDTFLIAAQSLTELNVLIIAPENANLYLQTAISSVNGFRNTTVRSLPGKNEVLNYNLVIWDGIKQWSPADAELAKSILTNGSNVLITFGADADINAINENISKLADLKLQAWDTLSQQVSGIQKSHPIVKDLFEELPENLQLPFCARHLTIQAGISANQRSIMHFRDGAPFISSYKVQSGQLFICSSPLDPSSGNFQTSYFFVPFLHQMSGLSGNNNIFSITAGTPTSLYLPRFSVNENDRAHLTGKNIDVIPQQKSVGRGMKVNFQDQVVHTGFYTLRNMAGDSVMIGINANRKESNILNWSLNDLKKNTAGAQFSWQNINTREKVAERTEQSRFPLWKLCSTLALLMLILETFLLSKNLIKQRQQPSI